MSMNLIAILISLAMMLTGAGAEGQPAEAARTLTLHDISLTINGERVNFDPVVRLGASTDGERALFDFGIDADGATLLPIQLASDGNGLTALFDKSDVAVNVPAQALESMAQVFTTEAMSAAEGDDAELMTFLTEEYIPAYVGMLTAMKDEAFLEEAQAKSEAIVDSIIDRGEGKPVTEEVEGQTVELTEYHYTVDSAKMAELCDVLLTSNDLFKAYYDAMFALFAKMPEEAGFSGIASYKDMFEKMGFDTAMEMDEKRSDDGDIQMVDAVLTMDMNGMIAKMAENQDAGELPVMAPIVMNIHGTKVGKNQTMNMDMTWSVDDVEMKMSMRATQGDDSMMADVSMDMLQDGAEIGAMHMNLGKGRAGAKGDSFSHMNFDMDVGEQARFKFAYQGSATPDGVAEGDFDFAFETEGNTYALAFIAEVTPDPIEDRVTGHTADIVIDDLSEDGLAALSQDQATMQALMKVSGSMMADVQKLASNEGVQALIALMAATGEEEVPYEIETADSADGEYVIDLGDLEFEDGDDFDIQIDGMDEDYEEIEDDGVLGFNLPEITWLPDGWKVGVENQDTAYDWADFNIVDDKGNDAMYALFFADTSDSQASYIVSDDGAVSPVEGREISVTDFADEGMSVAWREGKLYVNLVFYTNAIDVNTIGKIVAGIRF